MVIHLVRKTTLYLLLPLLVLIMLIVGGTSYLLVNIDKYPHQIKHVFSQVTNFDLDFTELHGGFNSRLQPTLNLANISIKSPQTNIKFLQVKNLSIALSYRSLYKLEPIFSYIMLNDSILNIEYDKDENLLVNHQIITNFKTAKPSSFNAEDFILNLHEFKLSNLNLTVLDSHDHLNPIVLKKINFDLTNHIANRHALVFNAQYARSKLNLELNWHGTKFSDLSSWQTGNLILINRDNLNHIINIRATIKEGKLESLNTHFDTSARQALALNNLIHGKSEITGDFSIIKQTDTLYNVVAKDLVINTESGPILSHASLNGSYEINKAGTINLSSLQLAGLNNFKFNQFSNKLSLGGSLKNINLSWYGPLNKPQDILLSAKFNNLAIFSLDSDIPSLNNINGDVVFRPNKGTLNLSLKNSKFVYPKQLIQPIVIDQLNTTTNWSIESHNEMIFTWQKSDLQTKDFTLITYGTYNTKTNYLNLHSNVVKLDIPQISNYLPRSESSMAKFIKTSIPTGWLSNMELSIKGELGKIPYANGDGEMNFTTQFNDVTFNFIEKWAPATHLNGVITTHNQAIVGKLTAGKLGNYTISNTAYAVPDITAANPQMNMSGFASGLTADFIEYLDHTPLSATIQTLPKQMTILGKSETSLKLILPLHTPDKFKLSGNWLFKNNIINLGSTLPQIDDLSGRLNFSNTGIEASHLTANALGSLLDIFPSAQTLSVSSPDLDYSALRKFFLHNNDDFISGRAASKVVYDINAARFTFSSDLKGVALNIPAPLNKSESETKPFSVSLYKPNSGNSTIDLSYSSLLLGKLTLNQNMQVILGKFALGTNDFNLKYHNNASPFTLNAQLKDLRILEWSSFINKMLPLANAKIEKNHTLGADKKSSYYPVYIELNTDEIWLQNYNIDGGRISISINKNNINGQIDVPDIYGQATYYTDTNKVDLNLNRLLISTNNLIKTESSTINKVVQPKPVTGTKLIMIPDIKVAIQNLYYQNHYLGKLNAMVLQRNNSLYIESATVDNKAGSTRFRIIDHDLGGKREYTELRLRTMINNYGILISKLNIRDNLRKGNGIFDLTLKWKGGIADFNSKKTIGQASLHVKNGEFTHINPGLLGSLLGVVSLTSITNVSSLNLNTFFGKGFAFNSWDMDVEVLFSKLKIDQLKLVSNAASINSFGNINLNDNVIDSYLTVEPRLGATVATTAGIVTLNPFIGLFVYAGQALIGNPVNKALGISYHIQGDVTNPSMTKIDLSDQIKQNFMSTTNILQHPETAFDFELNK